MRCEPWTTIDDEGDEDDVERVVMQDLFSPYSELNDSSEKKEFSCVKDHLRLMSK